MISKINLKGASSAVSRYNTLQGEYDRWKKSLRDKVKVSPSKEKNTDYERRLKTAKDVAEQAIQGTWVAKMHADMQQFKDVIDTIINGLTHNVKSGATNWIQGLGLKEWFHKNFKPS